MIVTRFTPGFTSPLKKEVRLFSTKGKNEEKNLNKEPNLNEEISFIDPNEINYVKQLAAKNVKWESTSKPKHESIGNVGDFNKYNFTVNSLYSIKDFKINLGMLGDMLKKLESNHSYAFGFIIRSVGTNRNISLDKHFLVNHDSNPFIILEQLYIRLMILAEKYYTVPVDRLFVKIRKISFKVKNQISLPIPTAHTNLHNKLPSGLSKLAQNEIVPHTMNLNLYGLEKTDEKDDKNNTNEKNKIDEKNKVIRIFDNGKVIIHVKIIKEGLHHIIDVYSYDGRFLYKFEDTKNGDGFKRVWIDDNIIYYFDNSGIVNIEIPQKVRHIEPVRQEQKFNNKILSFDIETYKIERPNGEIAMVPYACGFFDGKNLYTFYVTDYESHYAMLLACLKEMIKYDKYTVYCHNFSRFDINFIIHILVKEFKIDKIVSKDTDILSIKISHTITEEKKKGKNKVIRSSLSFSDSFRILPSSLEKLGKAYKVKTTKGYFPYDFVEENNLDYNGPTPDYNYYVDPKKGSMVSIFEWDKNYSINWSLRDETILYLEKDLISLYQIMLTMGVNTFNDYRVNITKVKTASSLALLVYRSCFLAVQVQERDLFSILDKKVPRLTYKYFIPILKGKVEEACRAAYYGGRNEIFTPIMNNVKCYDYNSLYPTAMLMPMPIGIPNYSLNKNINEIFGFVKAKVTAPSIRIPVLPCRVKLNGTTKLCFPIGTFESWWFSEELKLAIMYGYTVEVIESYTFEQSTEPFKDYIKNFAGIKANSEGAQREIAKLLLNTLYGRTGLKETAAEIKFVSSSELDKIQITNNVIDDFQVGDDMHYVRYDKKPCPILCDQSEQNYDLLSYLQSEKDGFIVNSTSIAAATASWARILMYPHILKSGYTDTDSIFVEKPLDPKIIGKGLGKFKAEYENRLINRAMFISGKLYLLDINGEIKIKCKGVTITKDNSIENLDISHFEDLYQGKPVRILQERWARNMECGTVNVKKMEYNLISGYDKREKIFSKGLWVDTSPLCINENFEVISKSLIVISRSLIVYDNSYSKRLNNEI